MPVDQPVDLEANPPIQPFASQGAGVPVEQFPSLSRSLSRRAGDPRALALQERRVADTEHLADRRFAVDAQKLELEKIRHLTDLQTEEAKIRGGFEAERQKQVVMKGLLDIKPGEDFQTRALELAAENPQAMSDRYIQHHIATRISDAATQSRYRGELDLFRQKQDLERQRVIAERDDIDARAKALRAAPENTGMTAEQMTPHGAGGSVTLRSEKATPKKIPLGAAIDAAKIAASENAQYGSYKDKVFTPIAAGQEGQTHVRLSYAHPTKGTVAEILPRDEYETDMNARKAAVAAAAAAPPAAEPPVASLPAPTDAAITLLRSHPEMSDKFDAVHGPGSSKQYLPQ